MKTLRAILLFFSRVSPPSQRRMLNFLMTIRAHKAMRPGRAESEPRPAEHVSDAPQPLV